MWDGLGEAAVVALLIHGEDGDYLAPPVVFDDRGEIVMGREVLAAVSESGESIEHPVIRGCTPGQLAELEQFLAEVRERLGVEGDII